MEKDKSKNWEKLRSQRDMYANKAVAVEEDLTTQVFNHYVDKDKRDELVDKAEKFHFSNKRLDNIKACFENYNQDNMNYNVIEDVLDAKKYVEGREREKEREMNSGFFTKIGNVAVTSKE